MSFERADEVFPFALFSNQRPREMKVMRLVDVSKKTVGWCSAPAEQMA